MKKVLLIAGLAVLSTSAFATKARIGALGTGAGYFIADSTGVLGNPSDLNGVKNLIVTEWGTASAANTVVDPRAEGGFFREMGTFTYGVYLGNDTVRAGRPATATNFLSQDNAIDFFLAGDMGAKWGAKLHYANSKDQTGAANTARKNSALGIALGGKHGDMGAFLNLDLSDKSTGNGTVASYESKLKPSYKLGFTYDFSGMNFYAEYSALKIENVEAATTTQKNTEIVLGVGRIHEINPTSRVFSNIFLSMATEETTSKIKTNKLPLTIGLEADAMSWLALRGSLSQNIILGEKDVAGTKSSVANSTEVNAGATLNFGSLKLDGLVGSTGIASASSKLLARVGLTYAY